MIAIDDWLSGNIKARTGVTLSPVRAKNEIREKVHENITDATELTITFKPEIQNTWEEGGLKYLTEKTLRRTLKTAPETFRLILVGEHSGTGLFHFHGFFKNLPNDKVAKLRRACSRYLGRTEIKMISYESSYEAYMFKSYEYHEKPPEEWTKNCYILINVP